MNWGDSGQGSNGGGGSPNRQNGAAGSDEAAALAARLAFANAYENGGNAASSGAFLDAYAAGQPSSATMGDPERAAMLYAQAQRTRELEMLHLQQQIHDRQVLENEARNRLLEHAARNHIQEYERTQMEMALVEEIQQRDHARMAAERELAAQAAANAAMLSSQQQELDAANTGAHTEQQLREYIANQGGGVSDNNTTNNVEGNHTASGFQIASSTTTNNSNTTKDEVQQKKKPSPKKESPTKKDATKKSSSPKRKKSPQKEGTSSSVPVHISTSLLDSKISPIKAKSSSATPTKKRKKAPSKASSSGGAGAASKAKKPRKTPTAGGGGKRGPTHSTTSLIIKRNPGTPSMDDIVPPITDVQYENVEALMTEFCKVPFLAEFSRPVSLLHPELVKLYTKIIHYPMDLGHVCRSIRRREYKNTRAIQLDVWRVFSNCIKFHMHPTNKENAIPSFISIAMHLRDFFNSLWREYMMPSDAPKRAPGKGISHIHSAFQKRAEARKERLPQVSSTVLTPKSMRKLSVGLESFISSGGNVDKLDRDAILGDVNNATGDIATFIQSLRGVIKTMQAKIEDGEEYTVMELHRDFKRCYTDDVFEHEILKKMKISQRLDRILGKALAPIHEVGCRGVNQSSIWGCMAAAIWARESKKKPYWPAIVLGILAPDDQKEDWHQSLTDRNEARLPEKLRDDLKAAKRRAELGLKKQSTDVMSYFLVEFMGSHEFIWVKESDIIESFDPEEDVNIAAAAGNVTKKRRSTAFNSKQMTNAIEEGRWALEEFELQLNNTCGDRSDDEDDIDNDTGYTYDILCQSDEEADEIDEDDNKGRESDTEELNELLEHDGLLDFSVEGRKRAKARATALKKQNTLLAKKEREKAMGVKVVKAKPAGKATPAKADTQKIERQRELEEKRAQREIEARRKKRARDHEKLLKEAERKAKRTKSIPSKVNPNDIPNKRGRADTIAKGFLIRKCVQDASYSGAAFQPTSQIEPSGLLGMALAFRAAAGEVPVIETNDKPFIENSWDHIDADTPMESSERCKRLQEKIDLIGEEMVKVDADTEQRLALTEDAKKAHLVAQNKILEAEEHVRSAYAKKKKKSITPKKVESATCAKPDTVKSEGGDKGPELVKDESRTSDTKPNAEAKIEQSNNGHGKCETSTTKPTADVKLECGYKVEDDNTGNGEHASTKPNVAAKSESSEPKEMSADLEPTENDEAIAKAMEMHF